MLRCFRTRVAEELALQVLLGLPWYCQCDHWAQTSYLSPHVKPVPPPILLIPPTVPLTAYMILAVA